MMKVDKKIIVIFILSGLLVVFTGYVAWERVALVTAGKISRAYDEGIMDAGKAIYKKSQECQPFTIEVEAQAVSLINLDCLKKIKEAGITPGVNLSESEKTDNKQ